MRVRSKKITSLLFILIPLCFCYGQKIHKLNVSVADIDGNKLLNQYTVKISTVSGVNIIEENVKDSFNYSILLPDTANYLVEVIKDEYGKTSDNPKSLNLAGREKLTEFFFTFQMRRFLIEHPPYQVIYTKNAFLLNEEQKKEMIEFINNEDVKKCRLMFFIYSFQSEKKKTSKLREQEIKKILKSTAFPVNHVSFKLETIPDSAYQSPFAIPRIVEILK